MLIFFFNQLAEKLEILFNMDFGDKSLRGTPEPFDEVQRHCKRRTTLMLKHYIKPYYVNFQGNRNFQKFMQSCADRLARSTPHIGNLASLKYIWILCRFLQVHKLSLKEFLTRLNPKK